MGNLTLPPCRALIDNITHCKPKEGSEPSRQVMIAVKLTLKGAPAEIMRLLVSAEPLPVDNGEANPRAVHDILKSFWNDIGALKFFGFGAIPFAAVFESHQVILGDHTFSPVKVAKFEATLRDELKTDLSFSVIISPSDSQLAWLAHRLEDEVACRIEPLTGDMLDQLRETPVDTKGMTAKEAVHYVKGLLTLKQVDDVMARDKRPSVERACQMRLDELNGQQPATPTADLILGEGQDSPPTDEVAGRRAILQMEDRLDEVNALEPEVFDEPVFDPLKAWLLERQFVTVTRLSKFLGCTPQRAGEICAVLERAKVFGPVDPNNGYPVKLKKSAKKATAAEWDGEGEDPVYATAVDCVKGTGKASISGVQRHLKIGYNRAARLIERMETEGVVGPLQANGSREVFK